ncbi:squalene/phytoene synthase family protein [Desmonostoc muscorum LEGE 12446]|uniref:Squalene/phytoene synthase family protein n=1 Tax=Desmonostoc muscorum LEGE 12446 TaxID=1828758 RepID=A0A8J7DBK4_DESMC|nr:squalene/phytoene synthase family protein [Desmonostoc muscorum]MCF2151404.1 squalene/phytoene synthase family protein [Desmonostoc muscorum LEGE 12446]
MSNLLKNAIFELGGSPTTLTKLGPAWSAAENWTVFNNKQNPDFIPIITTELVPSTFPGGGSKMIHVKTNGLRCGLVQGFGAIDTGSPSAIASAWIYVVSGKVGIGTGNQGHTGLDVISSKTNTWEHLQSPNGVSPANQLIIYSASDGAEFYVDLEEPLDSYMATAYLIFRVADNIEDCLQTPEWKRSRFAQLQQLLETPRYANSLLAHWSSLEWPGLTADEQQLMTPEAGLSLWQIYEMLPSTTRATIRQWVTAMIDGVESILDPYQMPHLIEQQGVKILAQPEDYDRYCYFVAGTVGHLGTELAIEYYKFSSEVSDRLLINCEYCGQALQKTNIIKDFVEDLRQGKCYLPASWLQEIDYKPLALQEAPTRWTQKVINSAVTALDQSVAYVLNIPYHAPGYRLASILCLVSAYQTLLLASQQHSRLFTAEHQVKISRSCFSQCMEDAKVLLRDNQAVINYSQRLQQEIAAAFLNL